MLSSYLLFFFNDTATTEIYTLSLHDALPISICKTALKNEQAVTKSIQKIAELALKQKDFATRNFIQWFVDEQIEEEQKFETILQKFDLLGRDKLAIYEINKLLGSSASSTEE